jgi:hypothetical protein
MKKILVTLSFFFLLVAMVKGQQYEINYTVSSNGGVPGGQGTNYISIYIQGPFGSESINNNGGFAIGNYTGTKVVNGRPTGITASGSCYVEGTIAPFNSAPYCIGYVSSYNSNGGNVCSAVSFNANIQMLPKVPLTSNLSVPATLCQGNSVTLTAPVNLPKYIWQYTSDGGTSWSTLNSAGTNVQAASLTMIGMSNANKNIYFRCHATNCGITTATANPSIGPFVFRASPPSATSITPVAPSCHNGTNSKVSINSISRALNTGETVQFELRNSSNVVVKMSEKSSTLPIVLDGGTGLSVSPGTYTLRTILYHNNNDITCSVVSTSVTINNTPILTNSPSITQQIKCVNSSTGQITVAASGGSGSLQYSNNNGSTYQSSNVFSNLAKGTYQVIVRDANATSCITAAQAVSLNDPTDISIASAFVSSNYNGRHISCVGSANGQITVNASGGTGALTYSRDGSTFQSGTVFTGLTANTYTITVRDANLCTKASSPVIVSAPPVVTATASANNTTCYGSSDGTITVSASGGTSTLTYSLNGTTFQVSNVFTTKSADSYTVTVRDANSCLTTTTVDVGQPARINVSANSTVVSCFGGNDATVTLTATNGVGAYSYSIDNGDSYQASNTFSNLTASTYAIRVRDANSCQRTASHTVASNPVMNGAITINSPVRCNGEANGALNLTPSGGVGPYTFKWLHGPTSEDVSGLSAGNYSVTITDSKACQKIINYALAEPVKLNVTGIPSDFNGYNISCSGSSNGSVDATITGGTVPYSYAWSNGSSAQDLAGVTAGNYQLVATDARGCTAIKSFNIVAPSPVSSTIASANNISCFAGNNGSITVSTTGGTDSYTYSINGTSWNSGSTFANLSAGTYTIYSRDLNNCQTSVSKTLTAPAELLVSASTQTTTCGQTNGTAVATASGGVPTYSYQWYNNSNAVIGSTASINDLGAGIYRVAVTDQNACMKQKTVTVSTSDGPVINVESITPTSCFESSDGTAAISISQGQAPYTIGWPTGQTTIQGTGLSSGQQIVAVSDAAGCDVFETITIPSPDPLSIQSVFTEPSCFGKSDASIQTTVQGGNGNYSYNWSNGASSSDVNNIKAGTYKLTVSDGKGCTVTNEFTLTDPELFTINAGPDIEVCSGQSVTLRVNAENSTYKWTSGAGFNSTGQQVTVNTPGSYSVEATNGNGCKAYDEVEVILNKDLLKTDFLMTAEAFVGDSIAIIDISWPMPETISWVFDPNATIVEEGQDWATVVFEKEGIYSFGLSAQLAGCSGYHAHKIVIRKKDEPSDNGRVADKLIDDLSVYPNSSTGNFNLFVTLTQVNNVVVEMSSIDHNKAIYKEVLSGSDRYKRYYDFNTLTSGVYHLYVTAGKETRMIRVIIQ